MWARFCGFLVLLLVHIILSLAGVSGRVLPPNHDAFALNNQGSVQNHQPLQITHPSSKVIMGAEEKGEKYREIKKIGSKPPSCSHRCYGCTPCEAIQVPATAAAAGHVGVLYTNYEPEGWKCKCGPTLYTP